MNNGGKVHYPLVSCSKISGKDSREDHKISEKNSRKNKKVARFPEISPEYRGLQDENKNFSKGLRDKFPENDHRRIGVGPASLLSVTRL